MSTSKKSNARGELRDKISEVDSQSASRVAEIDELIKERARQTLAERTREGSLLVLGGALQLAGAAVLLTGWSLF